MENQAQEIPIRNRPLRQRSNDDVLYDLVNEHCSLNEKIVSLKNALDNYRDKIPEEHIPLLENQLLYMKSYDQILRDRIKLTLE